MSSKMRMLIINEIDSAALAVTVGDVVPSLPVDNLRIYNNSRVFRSLTPAETQIVGTFTDFRLVSAIVLWRHNLSNAATFRLELFSGPDATEDNIYDSGNVLAAEQRIWTEWQWQTELLVSSVLDGRDVRYGQHFFESQFCLSFRLTINDPEPTGDYMDIARLYMGNHFEPSVNFSYGSQQQYGSNEVQFRTDDGSLFTQSSPLYRTLKFSLDYLSDIDQTTILAAIRYVGLTKDFYISMHPDPASGFRHTESSFACKFAKYPPINAIFYNNSAAQLEIEEV